MTKVMKMLGGSGLAAVLGVVLLGFSGAFNATTVSAESPPNPPSRFVGSVKVDGANAPAGTTIEAKIGTTTCGVASVFAAGGESRYALDSPALDPGANPNCGTDGAVVTFYIGGKLAAETGKWANYQLGTVNLTYTTPVAATATPGAGTCCGVRSVTRRTDRGPCVDCACGQPLRFSDQPRRPDRATPLQ